MNPANYKASLKILHGFKKRYWISLLGVFFLISLFNLFLARFGVDPHHDGIMFGAALAASEGSLPYRDYFAMYGWPIAVIQGTVFSVFEPTVYILRGVSAVLLAIATTLLWKNWSRDYGIRTGGIALITVIATTPFASLNYELLPWNSDLILLCQVLLLSLFHYISKEDFNQKDHIFFVAIAVLLYLILWSRLLVGVATLILVSIALIGYQKLTLLRNILVPFFVFNLLTLFLLWTTNSLEDFLFQFLEFPQKIYIEVRGLNGLRGIAVSIVLHLPFVLIISISDKNTKITQRLHIQVLRSFLFIAAIASIIFQFIVNQNSLKLWLTRIVPEMILWIVLIAALVNAANLSFARAKKNRENSTSTNFRLSLQSAVIVGGFVQVFPIYDWYHLWWVSIPAVGLVVERIGWFSGKNNLQKKFNSSIYILILIMYLSSSLALKLNREFVNASSIKILDKSLVHQTVFEYGAPTMLLIQKIQEVTGPKMVVNMCGDGLYSGLGQARNMFSPFYVNWDFGIGTDLRNPKTIRSLIGDQPLVVYCVPADYSWKTDSNDLFKPIRHLEFILINAYFCDLLPSKSNGSGSYLTLGIPNTLAGWLRANSYADSNICVSYIEPVN
jgi:hypothetical protein